MGLSETILVQLGMSGMVKKGILESFISTISTELSIRFAFMRVP